MPNFDSTYTRQLALLVDVLPVVRTEAAFALKGGTAINLFFRDLPRLSIDIDLTWLPLGERRDSLGGITSALQRIGNVLGENHGCEVRPRVTPDGVPTGLAINRRRVPIKIDVTPVSRGSVFPAEIRNLQPAVAERFGLIESQTLGFADLFAGKMVAALDRQHPRDLFDVMHLLATEGITNELWSVFLVYLTATGRPAAELIAPNLLPLEDRFAVEFAGMADEAVDVRSLIRAREELIAEIHSRIDDNVRQFLFSIEHESPEWERLALPDHVPQLPALRWKLLNLRKRLPKKRDADHRQLAEVLVRIDR
ncbi:MAG TPA: nucleotidyl transferase AbiEii/AbiGii toxin family protein [Dokdonella sp.]|uniref:nucleotidyl transferase AbiEii/AbiGii toxin family protein n=1 Tax=Dokdonella sp. TaxID=2291710 RepID=UPI002D7EB046|nr:nucleotidyl transferase AbiEii/AbiGii toxin family protein [Dokdonella sp.]HET9033329.1 nucleotidyl transferase AbiEii/AbiGii toxin family protein [Dokdonella sp.]